MLNRLINFSLKNRLLVLVSSVLLIVFGSYISTKMEVDVFPDLTAPTVVVLTEAHGMAPEEVEKLVTFPIETAVNGATNVRRVRSSSSAGISIVWVEFDWNTDIFKARQIVNEKVAVISQQLPEGVANPVLAPQSSIMGEIMLVAVTSKKTSQIDLRTIADWNIRPRLLATGGVAQVVVTGGEYKQYQILASPEKMKAYGVSLNDLLKASKESNGNSSGGFMYEHSNEYIVKGIGRTNDVAEIGKSVIKNVNGNPIKIEDVAEVKIGAAPKIGDGSLKGEPAVIMTVVKQPATNTLELTKSIDLAIADIKKTIPGDVEINTKIFRQQDFIDASISNIQKVLIEGAIFVIVILFLFLMNWRATLISLVAIPISIIVSILTLKWLGFTINTMSLGGMAIAVGDLVDDAIIDVENVLKRLKENTKLPKDQQKDKLTVIFDASFEIRHSIINATFIIIIAFIPLFFLSGMEGKLLAPLGIAFIVSLFASLIVSITLTPVLCSYLLTNDKRLEKASKESWLVERIQKIYNKALLFVMNWKKTAIGLVVGLFAIAMLLFTQLGRSFLPEFNEGSLVVSAVSLPGISLEESNKIGQRVEQALLSVPEIKVTTRRTGRAELDEHAQGVNAAEIDAPFVLEDRSRDEFLNDVREKLATVSGVNITIGQPIGHRIDHMLSGTRANIAIKIFGSDLNQLFKTSNEIKDAIQNVPGLVDLSVEQQVEIPQIQIKANREMLNQYGITIGEFNEFVDVSFAGEKVSEIYEGNKTFDLMLRLDDANRGNIDKIKNAMIDGTNGQKIPLYYVADVVSTTGPNTINRENVQRKTVVSANVSGRDQKSVVEEIQKIINEKVKLPEDYHIEYGGQFEAEAEASKTLIATSLLSILIIFLILFREFKTVKLAAIILINLPLALIGGVFSIYFTSGILSIPAIIGFITLFGVATRNGILLISHYNTLREEGYTLFDTVIQGSKDRLSPILMTALTAGLALIPLAIAGDLPGNEIQSPMAKVILGGLLTSTILNIFIVPAVYYLSNKKEATK
ncbi:MULTISPECIES: efflux RND transporter permease subunit [Chryseobacterium]|uniref:Cation efflux system protein CzcA n=2 Tax=Bacteroidota TaxID=976 RepID=A0A4U8WBH0_9FLAO|nr:MULTISPECIES: efflux RND transporter permease subunit [Chryseobacterium]AZA56524.1 efflux RND transporter permease subunit [Chryseobacterium shandongense]QQV03020.1 efflux RND transporter permease subunit [Chryseobacterium sp. FDAARGOS 1104]VFB03691.1 Cation efflux system protein CzcA [Chryseobacterium taihuense]